MREDFKQEDGYFSNRIKHRLGLFAVISASIVLYFILLRWDQMMELLDNVTGILQPITFGLILAYLFRSPINFFEQKIFDHRKSATLRLLNSVLIVYVAAGFCIYLLGSVIWPELKKNVVNVVTELPDQINYVVGYIEYLLSAESGLNEIAKAILEQVYEKAVHWLEYDMWDYFNVVLSTVTVGVIDLAKLLFNFIIGVLVSVYVLLERKHFATQSKKLVYAFVKPKDAQILLETAKETDKIFSGFIIGKIIDSAIIGLLCFISLTILKMPYTVLVSIIVGVTNVIPFFGPYIGAIPSAALIILADWKQGIVFIIFIILLQQLDGNVIGPKILGDSTGVASFWIVFAILLAGGLFGIPGMIMGVPTFATLYYIIKTYINYKLKKNGSMKYVEDSEEQ